MTNASRPRSPLAPQHAGFEWRAALGPWRWLILGTLGVAPSACGGRADQQGPSVDEQGGSAGAATHSTLSGVAGSRGTALGGSGSGASGGAGGSSVTTGGAGGIGGTGPVGPACQNPRALGGGWWECANGMIHRTERNVCPSSLPRPGLAGGAVAQPDAGAGGGAGVNAGDCRQDSDCTEAPHGYCELDSDFPGGMYQAYCQYGCVDDSECSTGFVCLCGEVAGTCAEASCQSDSDCAGALCTDYVANPGCGGVAFACQTASDSCFLESDCSSGLSCGLAGNLGPQRQCVGQTCSIGRPFLVQGEARLAPSVARSDWYGELPAALAAALDPALCAEIARSWTEQALMEHASVAAFARFSLQLLSLGAPPGLLLGAAQAMQDEVQHAQACFALARRYSDAELGPGCLPIENALEHQDLRSVVLGTIIEGCIGETVAALEAAEALAHCEDGAACAVLARIAAEETRHAQLAWQFVAWALQVGPPDLVQHVRLAFADAASNSVGSPAVGSDPERELARHGLLALPLRQALRQRVLSDVVAPCAEALLAQAGRQAGTASPHALLPSPARAPDRGGRTRTQPPTCRSFSC
jgi:hypothetical protein